MQIKKISALASIKRSNKVSALQISKDATHQERDKILKDAIKSIQSLTRGNSSVTIVIAES